jgi:predicted SprT family Zn-dependent metalloprotease
VVVRTSIWNIESLKVNGPAGFISTGKTNSWGRKRRTRTMVVSKRCLQWAQRARELMAQHGLHDWSFAYNRRKRALGVCYCSKKIIQLSTYFVDHNEDHYVRDIVLHEIAHALAGKAAGHGYLWKLKCMEIGAKPDRVCCDPAVKMPEVNHNVVYKAECPRCKQVYKKYRLSKNLRNPNARFYCAMPSCKRSMVRVFFHKDGGA